MVCKNNVFWSFIFDISQLILHLMVWMHVANIHVEGTVSQMFHLGISFCFMSKNG